MVTPAAERRAVAHLKEAFGMSERRARKTIGCFGMTVRYESTRPDDRDLRERIKAIAHERRRFGQGLENIAIRSLRNVHLVVRFNQFERIW
jgi:putative transposase